MMNDTIAAIATPIGKGGIGIVRISGPHAQSITLPLFRPKAGKDPTAPKALSDSFASHHLNLGHIESPENGCVIDEVLLVVMKAPNSYTCEDVVEIQSHGGYVVLEQILTLILKAGARLAEPGEFTKRAFLNGRIDLSQAEAVEAMITAKSEAGLRMAANQLGGSLKQTIEGLADVLTQVQVEVEADIEFTDEIESVILPDNLILTLKDKVEAPIYALIDQYKHGHVFRDGIRLGIVGRPNVGKSSLLNRLIQKDKAIVTDLPGTTRDLVEDHISISGIPVLITDTAGLHQTEDPIEIIGMQKTKQNIEQSDIVLWVVDGQMGITPSDGIIYDEAKGRQILLVVNKVDLMAEGQKIKIEAKYSTVANAYVSAKHGTGIEELRMMIKDTCLQDVDVDPGAILISNFRQKQALENALASISRAIDGLAQGQTTEMVVQDLLETKNALFMITGEQFSEDVLDKIFSKFCIGK